MVNGKRGATPSLFVRFPVFCHGVEANPPILISYIGCKKEELNPKMKKIEKKLNMYYNENGV